MPVKSKVFAAELAVAGRPEHGGAAALNAHYSIEKGGADRVCAAAKTPTYAALAATYQRARLTRPKGCSRRSRSTT